MLKALHRHPLLVGMAEVLTDATRYVAIILVVLLLRRPLAVAVVPSVTMRRRLRHRRSKPAPRPALSDL
jgi:hypothetical protein